MADCAKSRLWMFGAVAVAMVALRIVTVWGVPFAAAPDSLYDDGLFMRLAAALRSGNWLGEYTPTTLIKGPGYPMFVAMSAWARVPLPVAEQLLYGWACVLVVWALYPAVQRRWVLYVCFVVMMLNPWTLGPIPDRFTRDTIAAQLAVWVLAGAMGIVIRRKDSIGVIALWAVIAGIGGAWTWLTREEGVWVVGPAALLLGVAAAVVLWLRESRGALRSGAILVLPLVIGLAPVLGVCEMNRRHYGVFKVVDLNCREFQDAYGAMLRVGMGFHSQYVPLPREGRKALYPLSPTFKMMEPLLEGEHGYNWSGHRPSDGPVDMQGGWFIWAFREAAQQVAGVKGGPPLEFYRKLADDVNGACDAGLIPCGGKRSGFTTPLVWQDMGTVAESMVRFTGWLFWWPEQPDDWVVVAAPGPGAELAKSMSGMDLCTAEHAQSVSGWAVAERPRLQVDAEMEDGRRVRFRSQWSLSPDVKAYLAADGLNWPGAERARFSALVPPGTRVMRVLVDKKPVLRVPLADIGRVASGGGAMMNLDSVTPPSKRVVPVWKERVVHGCGFVLGCVSPLMTGLAFAWLAIAPFVRGLRNWRWIGIGATLAVAIVIRTALLAYIDGTTYQIWGYRYFQPTFAVLVLFWCVAGCALADAAARWRGARGRVNEEVLAR